jgi:hypothetical protein
LIKKDEVFGELRYGAYWERPLKLSYAGADLTAKLIVEAYEDARFTDNQRKSYLWFAEHTETALREAQDALRRYVAEHRDDLAAKPGDLRIDISSVFITDASGEAKTEFALLYDSNADPEHGLCAIFRDGAIVKTGPQDIVL